MINNGIILQEISGEFLLMFLIFLKQLNFKVKI